MFQYFEPSLMSCLGCIETNKVQFFPFIIKMVFVSH